MTHEQKLAELGIALMRVRKAVRRLEDRFDDFDLPADERVSLALRLPTLRADRDALDARLVALAANMTVLAQVPDSVFQQLKKATEQLAETLKGNQIGSALVGMATNLMGMARAATG